MQLLAPDENLETSHEIKTPLSIFRWMKRKKDCGGRIIRVDIGTFFVYVASCDNV
jgi:hypothetical protein